MTDQPSLEKGDIPGREDADPASATDTDLRLVIPRNMITTAQVRAKFQDFFARHDHTHVDSVSLLPIGDPSILFVNSGMVPFKDCFRGLETRPYTRATSCQKSLRVSGKHNDYEQIGETRRHHTFFEMLGNFSLGDYFKREAISLAWKFVTKELQMSKDHLWVTVHHSDDEAEQLWKEIGVPADRIVRLGDESNLWAMGDFGPRGYSSEIFYYMGDKPESQSREEFMKDDGTYLEFWNLVFMQFNRTADGTVTNLPKPCIDTGSGLERLVSILQGVKSNYDTDILRSLIAVTEDLSGLTYNGTTYDRSALTSRQWEIDVAMRVIADHSRAISFLIADGVAPSNEKEGYVLRRLIRRATLRGEVLGIHEPFLVKLTHSVENLMGDVYPELKKNRSQIDKLVSQEETQFRKTLAGGLRVLHEATDGMKQGAVLSGKVAFKLHDTFGFPLDLTEDVLKERGVNVDRAEFELLMEEQRNRSRPVPKTLGKSAIAVKELGVEAPPSEFLGYDTLAADAKVQAVIASADPEITYIVLDATPFYAEMGGQIGDRGKIRIKDLSFEVLDTQKSSRGHIVHVARGPQGFTGGSLLAGESAVAEVDAPTRLMISQHHSGTHLLGAALRHVLGPRVEQRGSLVSAGKLRFDFTSQQGLTIEQMHEVQSIINQIIRENHETVTTVMPLEKARARGAVAVFGEKYGDRVRVVELGPLSVELCGGIHVARTGDIGMELLLSESGISAGVRRIEGVGGSAAFAEVLAMQQTLNSISGLLKGSSADILQRVESSQQHIAQLNSQLKERDNALARLLADRLMDEVSSSGNLRFVVSDVKEEISRDALLLTGNLLLAKVGSGAVVLGNRHSGGMVVLVSSDRADLINANSLVKDISASVGGKGGGKPQSASLANVPPQRFDEALNFARERFGLVN